MEKSFIDDLLLIATSKATQEQRRLMATLAVIDHDLHKKNVNTNIAGMIEKIFPGSEGERNG